MFKEGLLKILKLDGFIENLSTYLETRLELLKFEVKEDISRLLAKVIIWSVLAVVFLFFLMLFSVAVAYSLGSLVGMTGGFMIVSGFYLLVALVLLIFRKSIQLKLEKYLLEIVQQKSKENGTSGNK